MCDTQINTFGLYNGLHSYQGEEMDQVFWAHGCSGRYAGLLRKLQFSLKKKVENYHFTCSVCLGSFLFVFCFAFLFQQMKSKTRETTIGRKCKVQSCTVLRVGCQILKSQSAMQNSIKSPKLSVKYIPSWTVILSKVNIDNLPAIQKDRTKVKSVYKVLVLQVSVPQR